MTRSVHQLLAALSPGDAIGNEALAIQAQLRKAGFLSEIFAEKIHPAASLAARPLWDYPRVSSADAVCLYHFSIGTAAGSLIFGAPDRLVVLYHNITPPEWFLGYHRHLTRLCYQGRRELEAFVPRAELALGDSEFNRRELEAAGFPRTGVLPIVLDLATYRRRPAAVTRRLYEDGRTNILFVGRVIPNKRVDDLIRVFAVYQRYLNPRSRLLVVGDSKGHEAYYDTLAGMVRELRLDEVVFAGHVADDDLMAFYSSADVFLCLSEHEGFCVPLLEAMTFGVPVIAYDAGAVAETLGGAGVLLRSKDPEWVAGLVAQIAAEGPVRHAVLEGQERRLERLRREDFGALLLRSLAPVLGTTTGGGG